jgi:hypothetical protein
MQFVWEIRILTTHPRTHFSTVPALIRLIKGKPILARALHGIDAL